MTWPVGFFQAAPCFPGASRPAPRRASLGCAASYRRTFALFPRFGSAGAFMWPWSPPRHVLGSGAAGPRGANPCDENAAVTSPPTEHIHPQVPPGSLPGFKQYLFKTLLAVATVVGVRTAAPPSARGGSAECGVRLPFVSLPCCSGAVATAPSTASRPVPTRPWGRALLRPSARHGRVLTASGTSTVCLRRRLLPEQVTT